MFYCTINFAKIKVKFQKFIDTVNPILKSSFYTVLKKNYVNYIQSFLKKKKGLAKKFPFTLLFIISSYIKNKIFARKLHFFVFFKARFLFRTHIENIYFWWIYRINHTSHNTISYQRICKFFYTA